MGKSKSAKMALAAPSAPPGLAGGTPISQMVTLSIRKKIKKNKKLKDAEKMKEHIPALAIVETSSEEEKKKKTKAMTKMKELIPVLAAVESSGQKKKKKKKKMKELIPVPAEVESSSKKKKKKKKKMKEHIPVPAEVESSSKKKKKEMKKMMMEEKMKEDKETELEEEDAQPAQPGSGDLWYQRCKDLMREVSIREVELVGELTKDWAVDEVLEIVQDWDASTMGVSFSLESWSLENLVELLNKLKPAKAAKMCENYNEEEVVQIVPCLKVKTAVKILNRMFFDTEDPFLSKDECREVLLAFDEGKRTKVASALEGAEQLLNGKSKKKKKVVITLDSDKDGSADGSADDSADDNSEDGNMSSEEEEEEDSCDDSDDEDDLDGFIVNDEDMSEEDDDGSSAELSSDGVKSELEDW